MDRLEFPMAMTDRPVDRGALLAYLGLLVFHVAHVAEEVLGGFVIPLILFCLWLRGHRLAGELSALYAGLMVLNGLGHNIMTLVTGRYSGGYAGGFSGIGLAVSGGAFLIIQRRQRAGSR
jgi:hypothetical protein